MPEQITCIYCRQTAEAPAKGEHVILRGLKGTKTIPDVCGDCNNSLSKIDLEFLRESLVGLIRLATPGAGGRLKSAQSMFCSALNAWVDVVAKTEGLFVKPQIAVYGGRLVGRSHDEEGGLAVERFLKTYAEGRLRDAIQFDIGEDEEAHSTARVVIDVGEKSDRYYLRAASEEAARLLLGRLETGAAGLLADIRSGTDEVVTWNPSADSTLRIAPCIDAINRCAAKMAFNFACYRLKPEIMLREEFDPVREYIVGTGVRKPRRVVAADGEECLALDGRFVNFMPSHTMRVPGMPANFREGHFIALGLEPVPNGHSLVARASVYRSVQFAVNLGPMPAVPLAQLVTLLPAVISTPIEGGGDLIFTTI